MKVKNHYTVDINPLVISLNNYLSDCKIEGRAIISNYEDEISTSIKLDIYIDRADLSNMKEYLGYEPDIVDEEDENKIVLVSFLKLRKYGYENEDYFEGIPDAFSEEEIVGTTEEGIYCSINDLLSTLLTGKGLFTEEKYKEDNNENIIPYGEYHYQDLLGMHKYYYTKLSVIKKYSLNKETLSSSEIDNYIKTPGYYLTVREGSNRLTIVKINPYKS